MKKPLLIALAVFAVLCALLASNVFRVHREGARVRARYEAMCLAGRNKDLDSLAKFATSKLRAAHHQKQADLGWIADQLKYSGNAEPDISLSGDRAWITLSPHTVFWVIRTGNTVEMVKENGEWCFTGKVAID